MLWVVLVWDAACRRVTTSDALIANDPTSQFGGIWLETGEQATSPTPKHSNKYLFTSYKLDDFLERAAILDEEHMTAVVLAIFR